MTLSEWVELGKQGGAVLVPFLLGAIFWMNLDRNRLIAENKLKDDRLVKLSEKSIEVWTEVRAFLFHERKA